MVIFLLIVRITASAPVVPNILEEQKAGAGPLVEPVEEEPEEDEEEGEGGVSGSTKLKSKALTKQQEKINKMGLQNQ